MSLPNLTKEHEMARVLVTGARRGIGREITLTLARAGHEVVATMRDVGGCDLADIARQEQLTISLAAMDVDDDASVAGFFARPGMGPETFDVLINNAGILSINTIEDETIAGMQAMMNTNFFGAIRCMKAVVPAMRARRQGLILNISSISGRMTPFAQGGYAASKHALEAASEALAQELAPFGVRVALVEPGIIATDMAIAGLPQPRAGSAYPHGGRMVALFADTKQTGTPPSVVADTVLDIVSGRTTSFRTLCGQDAGVLIAMRGRMTDEAWIAMSDTTDDGIFFGRLTAAMKA
jgi:NAD(P)-dependent dehydrogenase (short-subunit alcohol dehydrogenase family)